MSCHVLTYVDVDGALQFVHLPEKSGQQRGFALPDRSDNRNQLPGGHADVDTTTGEQMFRIGTTEQPLHMLPNV